jgi:hypothetical protein
MPGCECRFWLFDENYSYPKGNQRQQQQWSGQLEEMGKVTTIIDQLAMVPVLLIPD